MFEVKQTELANKGQLNINFPASAKEIKASWRRIKNKAEDKARYHWVIFKKEDGSREIWGLTALHISTKDLPNWFWATFEHIDNKKVGVPAGGGEQSQADHDQADTTAGNGTLSDAHGYPNGSGRQ